MENAGSTVCSTLAFGANNPGEQQGKVSHEKQTGGLQMITLHPSLQPAKHEGSKIDHTLLKLAWKDGMPSLQRDVSAGGDFRLTLLYQLGIWWLGSALKLCYGRQHLPTLVRDTLATKKKKTKQKKGWIFMRGCLQQITHVEGAMGLASVKKKSAHLHG